MRAVTKARERWGNVEIVQGDKPAPSHPQIITPARYREGKRIGQVRTWRRLQLFEYVVNTLAVMFITWSVLDLLFKA